MVLQVSGDECVIGEEVRGGSLDQVRFFVESLLAVFFT